MRRIQTLFHQLSWVDRYFDRNRAELLPKFLHGKLLAPAHQAQRVAAVRDATDKARALAAAQWEYGLSSYVSRTQEEKGLESLWMGSRNGWTQWKVFTTFAEKSLTFMLSRGIVEKIIAPDACTSAHQDAESGSESLRADDICGKYSAVGLLVVACAVIALEIYARPYINSQEDMVEGLCRLANLFMTIALNIIEFNLFGGADGSPRLLFSLLVVPPCCAIGYSMYLPPADIFLGR